MLAGGRTVQVADESLGKQSLASGNSPIYASSLISFIMHYDKPRESGTLGWAGVNLSAYMPKLNLSLTPA